MTQKRAIDGAGAAALIGFAGLLAFNQVVIKVTGGGFGPVFQAGLRSVLGAVVLLIWMRARGVKMTLPQGAPAWGVICGILFAVEFICLYVALDLTTVSRTSIIFYSMPVWLALAGHVLLPGERLGGFRVFGLAMAMGGVVLALANRGTGAGASLTGDLLALAAAMLWAAIALLLRLSPLSRAAPEPQLMMQLLVSAPLMLAAAPLFGPLLRDPGPVHVAGLLFQSIFVVSLGFLLWFRLLSIYRANSVASFSFLSPVLAVIFGWVLLGETLDGSVWTALALVAGGIVLINRK